MKRLIDLGKSLYDLLRPGVRSAHSPVGFHRGQLTHVILLDGTMSSLRPGAETNVGRIYKLLCEARGSDLSIYYEAGVQWEDWRRTPAVMMGRGINRQIQRAYGYLASRYRPGDRIFLLGYSRGAFAVRSLAGVIDSVGLLRDEAAIERNIALAYRHYRIAADSPAARAFRRRFCHPQCEIEMVGVFDSVKALGLRLPLIWKMSDANHAFHNHRLGHVIRHGYHALALDETRAAYEPVLWDCPPDYDGDVEQVWFRGTHSDIGGQISGHVAARPLANIPLVWMLDKAEACGLPLPADWKARFPQDVTAPSVSSWDGWGKLFLIRRRRRVGADPSERLHESVGTRDIARPAGALREAS